MRIVGSLEGNPLTECRRLDMPLLVDVLQRRADARNVRVAIDIELVGRRLVSKLETVRLEFRVIAEFGVEPSPLGIAGWRARAPPRRHPRSHARSCHVR